MATPVRENMDTASYQNPDRQGGNIQTSDQTAIKNTYIANSL
jgi:hypothetical protein